MFYQSSASGQAARRSGWLVNTRMYRVQNQGQVLIGWMRWIRIRIPGIIIETMDPNLTVEQRELLNTIVEVYNSGCKGPFTLALSHTTPPHLTYVGHADV